MKTSWIIPFALVLYLTSSLAQAQSVDDVEAVHQTTLNLIKQLVKTGTLTQEAADQLLQEATQPAAQPVIVQPETYAIDSASDAAVEQVTKPGVVRIPFVPEAMRREIEDELHQKILAQARGERWGDPGSLPDWLNRISWNGDFRLRYQRDAFPAGNAPSGAFAPVSISNTTDTRQRLRLQTRVGMKAKISDNTFADFRLSTGSTTDPVSTNQTLGSNGNFNKYSLVWDRAYLQSAPYYWLTLKGGRMPNPWLSTDLVWDTDVNFEGVATTFIPKLLGEQWKTLFTAGAFPLQEIERSPTVLTSSKWLYGAQLGAEWTALDSSIAKIGMALYQFRNVEGVTNTIAGSHLYDKSATLGQKGNTLMPINAVGDPAIWGVASKFKELNITGQMDWASFDPIHVILTGDYVKNLGFDTNDITSRAGAVTAASILADKPQTVGYQAMLTVGTPKIKQRGEWQFNMAYKYLEKDAVLDAFTDSDFHLGGTNAKGFILGGVYGLDKNTTIGLRWYSSDQIDTKSPPLSIDTVQADVSVRF